MSEKVAIIFTILILVSFGVCLVGTVFAQTEIGISEGDVFTYEVSSNSNIPMTLWSARSRDPKDVASIQIQVTNVDSCYAIGLNITEFLKNGTALTCIQTKDLTSAAGFPIVATNLNVGDPLWSGATNSPLVEEITDQEFSDGTRTVLIATVPQSDSGYEQIDYYFDRTTGMPIEMRFSDYEEVMTVFTLVDSNVWTVPEWPSCFTILFLMAAVLVIATKAGFLKKSSKHLLPSCKNNDHG